MATAARLREGFAAAASWFATTVGRLPPDAWDRPGLGDWNVRALVGHTSRALITVEQYLAAPPAQVTIPDPVDYDLLALRSLGEPAAVSERGRQAGAALGDDPGAAVRTLADRVVALVERTDDDALVGTPVGGMRLAAYLPTRVFELTVHTLDLANAVGVRTDPPEAAAEVALEVLAGLAWRRGLAGALLLAATGRGPLPEGFNLL